MPDQPRAPRPAAPEASETGPPAPDLRLRRHQRLTSSRLFRETYDQGKRWAGRTMVLWLRSGDDVSMRLGVVASKKVGNAVKRARSKRRLREVFRLHRHLLSGEVDVVLVARYTIADAKWEAVVEDFLMLTEKAGLMRKEEDWNDGMME